MDTQLADFIRDTPAGKVAGEILRKCVHCGFCTATCPTYQLLGDELDGPRGRIYLIKQVLEGKAVSEKTRDHLDRCLTCRSCETTCPSGVKYSHLLDIGRAVVEEKLPRRLADSVTRALLKTVLPNPALFGPAVTLGRAVKPLLPSALADKLPDPTARPAPRRADFAPHQNPETHATAPGPSAGRRRRMARSPAPAPQAPDTERRKTAEARASHSSFCTCPRLPRLSPLQPLSCRCVPFGVQSLRSTPAPPWRRPLRAPR